MFRLWGYWTNRRRAFLWNIHIKDGDEKQIANRLRGMAYQGIIRLNPFMDKFVYAVNTSEIIHFIK